MEKRNSRCIVYINCVNYSEQTAQAAFERSFINYLQTRDDFQKYIFTTGKSQQSDHIVSVHLRKGNLLSHILWNFRLLKEFFKATRGTKEVLVYFRASGLMLPARIALRALGYKIFYRTESLYDNLFDYDKVKGSYWKPLIYLYEWIDFRLSTLNIVVTQVLVNKLQMRYFLSKDKVICIPNPLTFMPADSDFDLGEVEGVDRRFHLGYFGSLKEHQRLQDVIRAVHSLNNLKDLAKVNFKFMIFGGGPYEGELKELVASLNLDSLVQFRGAFDHSKLGMLYKEVDYLVAPYSKHWNDRKGSSALKIWEYLFFNKLVIAPDILDYKFLEDHGFGVLYKLEDVSSLTEVLSYLIENRPMVKGSEPREFVLENRSQNAVFAKYLDVMLNGGRP